MITAVRLDNEAIVGVNVSRFVNGVIPRSQPPCRISTLMATTIDILMILKVWARW